MPLFFLHLRDGNDFFHDPEGIPVRDLDAARTEALDSARSLMSQAINESAEVEADTAVPADPSPAAETVSPPSTEPAKRQTAR
jgi:hypothetical protein